MKIAVLTSSRADYGIYHALLEAFRNSPDIDYGLLVFGTHLRQRFGYTVSHIEADRHPIWARVDTLPEEDAPADISAAMGRTTAAFAEVYQQLSNRLDVVIALGDRYEMFAAVTAAVPFNLPVAHLHGGETSLGAIDDKFRHGITALSTLHFTATEPYAARVAGITGSEAGVFAVGAPSLDGLTEFPLYSVAAMREVFGFDFSQPTLLVTYHPETVDPGKNEEDGRQVCAALAHLSATYQVVITLPNADTKGTILRRQFLDLAGEQVRVLTIENFGKRGYFSAMKHCFCLVGNTSSGVIEAASFGKFAVDIGSRQAGRAASPNLIRVPAATETIIAAVATVQSLEGIYRGENIYVKDGRAAVAIHDRLLAWWRNQVSR